MTILVIGGTGNVGQPTVGSLVRAGESVRVFARSKVKAADLPDGVHVALGDLDSGAGLAEAFAGVTRLVLITAIGETEQARGLAAVRAAQQAGVHRIVFLSVQDAEAAPFIPHFRSKMAIENAIRTSGAEFVILRPNAFFQNDEAVGAAMLQYGVYPTPLGSVGLNRIDARDIGEAISRAIRGEWTLGADCALDGPETMTGEQIAAVYSRCLGKTVRYGGDDLARWGEQPRGVLSPWTIDALVKMFERIQRRGMLADEGSVERTKAAVGRPLTSFDDYARALAAKLLAK